MDKKPTKIYNLETINNEVIKKDGLNVLVVCYGGCCSNQFVYKLQQNGYKARSFLWDKILCHCPKYIDVNIPIIYIYDNPIKAFLSQKNRGKGYYDVNQRKLSNNLNIELSDENLLKLIIEQFNNWTNIRRNNVLIIKSNELFQDKIVNKLENFLKRKINHFPIQYKNSRTTDSNIEEFKSTELFKKYQLEIEKIINFEP